MIECITVGIVASILIPISIFYSFVFDKTMGGLFGFVIYRMMEEYLNE